MSIFIPNKMKRYFATLQSHPDDGFYIKLLVLTLTLIALMLVDLVCGYLQIKGII